tara:strand:- start:649 stop:1602 length:954 start_codon:yes stop_codon:yes gene_type:complete
MYDPICIKKYTIYDIFHNDNNKLIIIMPYSGGLLNIKYDNISFTLHKCDHNHTYIYVSDTSFSYKEKINITINNELIETKVNKYPEFKDKIIMSTIVKNEDDYIVQWIEFHLNIGIKHFIIYDNSKNNTLQNVLKKYISNNIVVLINWRYHYRNPKKWKDISGQTTQQCHSIWAFQNSKYIGLFDIDEYVNLQNDTNIDNYLSKLIEKYNLDLNTIGCFRLKNKFFYNPNNLPTNDFKFLNIFNCQKITPAGREKCFVLPKNVNTFSVHMITNGKKMHNLNKKEIYFNHYCFLNKKNRGNKMTTLTDNSILKHITNL